MISPQRLRRRLGLPLAAAACMVCAAWVAGTRLSLAGLAAHEQMLRERIAAHPVESWLIGWVVYFLAALVPGTRGKAVAFGWLFGFWPALLLVNLALTAAAQVAFLASRYLVGDLIQSRHGAALFRVNQLLDREGAWYVILLRVVPLSFSLSNYLLGATRVRAGTYWWATQVGLLPGNIMFVFLGAGLPSLSRLLEEGMGALFSWDIVAGLVGLSLFPFAVHALVRRWRPVLSQPQRVP